MGGGLKRFKSTDNLAPEDIGAATSGHTHNFLFAPDANGFETTYTFGTAMSGAFSADHTNILVAKFTDSLHCTITPSIFFPKREHFASVRLSTSNILMFSWISHLDDIAPQDNSIYSFLTKANLKDKWLMGYICIPNSSSFGGTIKTPITFKFTTVSSSSCVAYEVDCAGNSDYDTCTLLINYASRPLYYSF